jgi:glutamine phosphoribosylpyrophosphate amidotransferase
MCSVIGAVIRNPTTDHFNMIRRVFLESKIRGMHATGMSILFDNKIMTFKEPVSADKFVHLDSLEEMVNHDGTLYLIGHCRYSTSDLEYNQPLANEECSIVHNGVITQELPENWKTLYPEYACRTKNDSELVLHSHSPLEEFPDSSIAAIELWVDRKLITYRNGKRPLYFTSIDSGYIITSTKDIASRARVVGVTMEVPMNTYMTVDNNLTLDMQLVKTNKTDLQRVDYELSV